MNFFQQLSFLGLGMDVNLRIKGKNDKITVMVEPQQANLSKLRPLVLTGTAEELDDGFFAQFDGLVTATKGLSSNLDEVKQDAQDLKQPAVASPAKESKSPATHKKPPKEAPPKKDSKSKEKPDKAEKKKEATPAGPVVGDMFSQPAADASPAWGPGEPTDQEVDAELSQDEAKEEKDSE